MCGLISKGNGKRMYNRDLLSVFLYYPKVLTGFFLRKDVGEGTKLAVTQSARKEILELRATLVISFVLFLFLTVHI